MFDYSSLLEQTLADRAINPLPKDIYYLFNKWRSTNYGQKNGESMFEMLEQRVKEYNEKFSRDGGHAFIQRYLNKTKYEKTWESDSDQPLILAICTPLMDRAHAMLRQAAELVYIDATASLDRYNCPTFMMSTCSPAGGIPLGVVITSGEDEATITEAFTFIKTVLPKNSFYGRGSKGPQMCITDDSAAERTAIHNVWPETQLFLCIFHYLQSWWTWLWDSKQSIHKDHRPLIMQIIKTLVFTKSQEDLTKRYTAFMTRDDPESYVKLYPHLAKHLEIFWKRRSEWALSFRVEKIFRNNHTNNYAEAAIRILKEMIFGRVKAYNLIQMFNFITDTMETYYANRLLDMAHSRFRPGISLRFRDVQTSIKSVTKVEQFSESIYCVTENLEKENIEFLVDMEIGTCSCIKGVTGLECKHQAAVAKHYKVHSVNIPPFFSKQARQTFAILAVGASKVMEIDFYAHLRDTEVTHDTVQSSANDYDINSHTPTITSTETPRTEVVNHSHHTQKQADEWSQIIGTYKTKLNEITDDLILRLQKGDQNVTSGVSKFISMYTKLKASHSPSSAIGHALHMFAKEDSEYIVYCIHVHDCNYSEPRVTHRRNRITSYPYLSTVSHLQCTFMYIFYKMF